MNSNKISISDSIASIMAMNFIEESKPKLLILPHDSNVYQQMLYGTIGSSLPSCSEHIQLIKDL